MKKNYVLLTAAKNEEEYIGLAIESILRQSVHPSAWYIMDDGSTDRTAEIVASYAEEHSFIKLHSAGDGSSRNFGSQYKAIEAAFALAKQKDFDFVGVQDADIAPEPANYYEELLERFATSPKLGIAGGYIYERENGVFKARKGNAIDSVAGGVQMFRRECFEEIGGYKPLTLGGSDWLAQIEARMAGWEVESCPEFPIHHYRPTSSAGGRFQGLFKLGKLDGSFALHPLFEVFKCARRVTEKPLLIGSVVRFSGYLWWKLTRRESVIPPEAVRMSREEQMKKIKLALGLQRGAAAR